MTHNLLHIANEGKVAKLSELEVKTSERYIIFLH